MSSRLDRKLLISLIIISPIFISVIASNAKSMSYTYDGMNRLIEVVYGDGARIQYTYDAAGNRIEKKIQAETTPPTTTATPAGGTYNTAQSVALTCNVGTGSGCEKIYYTTDGSTPTTSSAVYLSAISIPVTTTLQFFARDEAGNSETVKTQTYTIGFSIVTVQLKDSNGNPISGGVVQYYSGGWKAFGTTDSNGRVSKELKTGSYTFSMTYAYGRQEKSQNIVTDPTVVFQTKRVSVQLKDSSGAFLDTGTAQYYAGGWRNIGDTSGGQIDKELLLGSYTFSMNYAFARKEKSQNITSDPIVVFNTGQIHSDSGSCTNYYAGGWRVFFQDMELLPATYTFRFNDGSPEGAFTITSGTINHIH